MNSTLIQELVERLRDPGTARALLLQGAGRAFCTGEDLRETLAPKSGSAEELRSSLELLQDATRLITAFPGAVVAAVQGFAVGGGAELALAADIVVASPETRFRFPEVAIGHALTGGITGRLPALVGLARAKEILLSGRWIGAEEALRIGMVAELNPKPQARALELATILASFPGRSIAATKRAVEAAAQADQNRQLQWELDAAMYCFAAPEAQKAFVRFAQKGTKPAQ